MANKRIYYAIQQVRIGDVSATGLLPVHGLQTVGMTTNFNLEQVFEIGQLEIYQNLEEIPDIEVTLNKVLDGYPGLYTMATENGAQGITGSRAVSPTLTGRQNARCDLELAIFPDSEVSATGAPISSDYAVVRCSGMYVSSVSYTFPVDGNFTEDVTLVGNDKIWGTGGADVGQFDNNDSPESDVGVNRRQHLNVTGCYFPVEIPGVDEDTGKLADNSDTGEGFSTHFQNITVSVDLGREAINELGRFAPYHRYVTFPDIGCTYRYNLRDQKIYLETCEGTKIYLGDKNKLSSVNYAGGDTGGGNVTVTYSYTTFNDFTVAQSGGLLSRSTGAGGSGWYDDVSDSGYNPS